ncbi:MAG: sulfate transporter CysZ [Nitrospira sp.]|nr:sulfate transporter CysZ [Candidatus Manganitrophaceae bacterium]HIL34175.1 sulfate transporter CysZ [Candidatus Manganitrophaceae bacterium]
MKDNPLRGAEYLLRGLVLIRQSGLRRYVLIPLAINAALFSLIIWFVAGQFDRLITWLLPTWLDWLEWFLWPLFAVSASILIFFTFIHLVHFIGAPFNGLLSEAAEAHLKGGPAKEEMGWKRMMANLWPILLSEFRKTTYFISRAIPILLLFFIPMVNVLAPFVWIGFSAWMLALEYSDYPMGNHGILFSKQWPILKEKRLMVLGFGGATLLLLMIPFLNSFAMPMAVAGATAMWVEQFAKE